MIPHKLNPTYILVIVIFIQGCQFKNSNQNKTNTTCPREITAKLEDGNVESIDLTSTPKVIDGIVTNDRPKGYRFTGKKNQKINYQVKPNGVCTWLYDTNNKIVNSPILPQDGTYVFQIATLEGSGTFQLNLSLDRTGEQAPKSSEIQTLRSPSPEVSTLPKSPVKRPPADKAVRDHYELINNRDLENSWNNLSDKFKGANLEQGKRGYEDWWNQVQSINIRQIELIRQNEKQAIVRMRLVYTMKTGKIVNDTHEHLYLVWNNNQGKWLIDDRR